MVMRSSAQSTSKGGTWKGVLLLLLLTTLSVLSMDILGRKVSFIFLPLMGVFLWPRIERPIASIIFILLFGLLLDLVSAGPLGLWSLVFLTVFAIVAPDRRVAPQTFISAFRLWFVVLLLALAATYCLGWFAIGSRPDLWALFYQAVAAIVLFPFVYGLRHFARNLVSDRSGL